MAPLPTNNTAVLFVDYSTCLENHTVQMRYASDSSASEAMTALDAFLTGLDVTLNEVTILGARVRDEGSNVTYPVTWTGDATYGASAGTHEKSAWFIDFVGRSIDGRRCRIEMFGAVAAFDGTQHDYRIETDNTTVAAALAALEANGSAPCSISGLAVNWHQYANLGVNAYWRNRIR